jgi:hypothetical protein
MEIDIPTLVDTTETGCTSRRRAFSEEAPQLNKAILQPERFTIKMGNLEIESTDTAGEHGLLGVFTRLRLDGKVIPFTRFVLTIDVNEVVKAELDFYPRDPNGPV